MSSWRQWKRLAERGELHDRDRRLQLLSDAMTSLALNSTGKGSPQAISALATSTHRFACASCLRCLSAEPRRHSTVQSAGIAGA